MTRNSEELLAESNPKPEQTCHSRKRANRKLNMAENQNNLLEGGENNNGARGAQPIRTMKDYVMPSLEGTSPNILRPVVQANNFDIKPPILQLIQHTCQFGGLPSEDPHQHITSFLQICDTFKYNGVSEYTNTLSRFPFSLRDKAQH